MERSARHEHEPVHPTEAPAGPDARGWILYDDSCGFCRRWIPAWAPTLDRRGFLTAPLQADWVRTRLAGATEAELLADMRLLLPDGTMLLGPEAYRFVMRRIWWLWPVWALSCLPPLRQLFDWSYRTFARHRHTVSKTCGLPGGE